VILLQVPGPVSQEEVCVRVQVLGAVFASVGFGRPGSDDRCRKLTKTEHATIPTRIKVISRVPCSATITGTAISSPPPASIIPGWGNFNTQHRRKLFLKTLRIWQGTC
jgi:hypothetical protein